MEQAFGYDRTQMVYRVGNRDVTLSELRKSFRKHLRADSIRGIIESAYRAFYMEGQRVPYMPTRQIDEWTEGLKVRNQIPPFVFAVWYAYEHADGQLEAGRRFMQLVLAA